MGSSSDRRATVLLGFVASEGLGGGIERYCDWLFGAVEDGGVRVIRVSLLQSGDTPSPYRKARFVLRSIIAARRVRAYGDVSVLVCHPSLAVATLVATRLAGLRPLRCQILFYGEDIWAFGRAATRIVRACRALPLTVSTFSSGALSHIGRAPVLRPGLRPAWFDSLSAAAGTHAPAESGDLHVLTTFRLDAAVAKGLPEVLDALEHVGRLHSCQLTVAGSGSLPPEIAERIARLQWVSVVGDPSDNDLAQLYADADLFVLATRTRSTPPTSGEGFGIVLVEAQLAGTPVIAPAFGGSDDAFLPGLTGLKPVDESAGALAALLGQLASDRPLLTRLGGNASAWSRAVFDPDRCASNARRLLFAEPTPSESCLLDLNLECVPFPAVATAEQ